MATKTARRVSGAVAAFVAALVLAIGMPIAAQAATVSTSVVGGTTNTTATSLSSGDDLVVSGSGYAANTSVHVAICDLTYDATTGTGCDNTYGNYVATSAHDTTASGSNVTVTTDASGTFTVALKTSQSFTRWNGRTNTTDGTANCSSFGSDQCGVQAVTYSPLLLGTRYLDF